MCLEDQIITSYLDNELTEPWKAQLEEHIFWCPACQKRVEQLKKLKQITQDAALEDEEITRSQDRVFRFLEKNILNSKKRTLKHKAKGLLSKKFFWPSFAAVLTFCFCLIIFQPSGKFNQSITPDISNSTALNLDNITPVRLSDNYTTIEALSNYSLEEILQYLDSAGFDVTLTTKALTPIQESETEPFKLSPTLGLGQGPIWDMANFIKLQKILSR